MTDREQYVPGPAGGAQVRKDGEKWTLILTRELRHPPRTGALPDHSPISLHAILSVCP